MKIGILRETKNPVDNRVALPPKQIRELQTQYPHITFKVQKSELRAYSDDEYRAEGIDVVDTIDDCDFLMGIKEADVSTLIPGKHYMFFGHIAKMQPYNKPLFKTLIDKAITFSDYEYLVDDNGIRLVAFGWYAGVVGLYYTLMGWGLKNKTYTLPRPHMHFTMEEMISNLKNAKLGNIKIVLTGSGRVSQGAQYILESINATKMGIEEFLSAENPQGMCYCVAPVEELVAPNDKNTKFNFEDFKENPQNYHETFSRFTSAADILICAHFWSNGQPVYLTKESFNKPGFRIKMIGDITCDIQGSIMSTLRAATHAEPFYDYNPVTGKEEKPFSAVNNITVMAVDTCPNALPRVTSQYFGEQLIKHVLADLLSTETDRSKVLDRATIVRSGELTDDFSYLTDYVAGF